MPATMKELGIDQWNQKDRAFLVDEIMETLGEIIDVGGDETEEEKRFIDARLAAIDADPQPGIPWREVIAQLRARS